VRVLGASSGESSDFDVDVPDDWSLEIRTRGGDDEVSVEPLGAGDFRGFEVFLGGGDDVIDASASSISITAHGEDGDDLIRGEA
jgi:hypothetical protein